MTTNEAKKLLGKDSRDVSDIDLKRDIELATLFKDIFFNNLIKSRKQDSKKLYNMP
jgi:hypothetical protein